MFTNIDELPLGKLLQTSYGGKSEKSKKSKKHISKIRNQGPPK